MISIAHTAAPLDALDTESPCSLQPKMPGLDWQLQHMARTATATAGASSCCTSGATSSPGLPAISAQAAGQLLARLQAVSKATGRALMTLVLA